MKTQNWMLKHCTKACAGLVFFTVISTLFLQGCDKSAQTRAEKTTATTNATTPLNEEAKNEDAKNEEPEVKEPQGPKDIEGDFYSVFSFLDNRPLAHELVGDFTYANAKYTAFIRNFWGDHARQWNREKIADQTVLALDKRRDGLLSMPAQVDHPNAMVMRVFNPVKNAKNILKITLNGKALANQDLDEGWNEVHWKLNGEGKLENLLSIEFSGLGRINGSLSGGAIKDIEIGNDPNNLDNTVKSITANDLADKGFDLTEKQGPLELKKETGAMWFFFDVPKTMLRVSLKGTDGCGVNLQFEESKDGTISNPNTFTLKIKGTSATAAFEIPANQDDVSRLVARPIKGCESVTISSLDLVVKGKKPARKTFEPPKHILVWMIDTLRSDHLPIHFKTDVQAPNLVKLASEGASFKWAIVQGNESKTSHASFFTGEYPDRHGVLAKGHLKPEDVLIPEALQKAGFKTAAYIANGYISKPWGFVQGWDFYRNNLRENYGISAAALREDASNWMEKNADKKFFMYVGTIDPHVSYHAHEGLIEKYGDPKYEGYYKKSCSGADLGKIKSNPDKVSDADRKQIHALYKNEIEYNDQEFGKLRAFMEEKGLWKNTLVVITADHGDEFWEHGSVGHGQSAYDELVHVPILFYYPPAIDAGVDPESSIDVLDIFPTILDLVGEKPLPSIQGKSVLPLMDKNLVVYPEPGIATRYRSHYSFQVENWTLLVKRGDFDVFDNNTDIHEQKNIAAQRPFATRALTDAAGWYLAAPKKWQKETWGTPTNLSPNFLELYKK